MKATTFALALAGSVAAATALPTFPLSWSSDMIQAMNINQGGVVQPDGSVCCPAQTPQCKVQTMFQPGIQYFDFQNNRTAFKQPDGSGVVSLYEDGKEYAVNAAGACQSYCPLQDTDFGPGLGFGDKTQDMGPVTYGGKKAEHFHWVQQMPILNITMETSDMYVVVKNNVGTPLAEIDNITPFGQHIGTQNTTYVTFTPTAPAASHFTVTGKSTCKIDQSCSGKSDDAPPMGKGASYVIRKHLGVGMLEVVAEE